MPQNPNEAAREKASPAARSEARWIAAEGLILRAAYFLLGLAIGWELWGRRLHALAGAMSGKLVAP